MSDLKDYVDLKADELKLRTTQGLSVATGRLAAALLLVGFLVSRKCGRVRPWWGTRENADGVVCK